MTLINSGGSRPVF